MKDRRILFFSRDPGGTNAIMPLIEPLRARGNEVRVFGKDAALSVYRKENIECSDIRDALLVGTQEEVDEFVQKIHPDLLVTGTSSEDFTERRFWKAAQKAGITSFAVLDQWTNYRLRLVSEDDPLKTIGTSSELIVPSFVFIMDEFAKEEMCALGIDPERLLVSGQPFFDHIHATGDSLSTREIKGVRRQLSGNDGGPIIVFASQPIARIHQMNGMAEDYWGYTEKTILTYLTKCLSKLTEELDSKVTLVLRLHPKDESNVYEEEMTSLPGSIRAVVDKEINSSLLLKASDLVIGMFSMLLLEAAILNRQFLSVQIGLTRENPLVFDRMGLVSSIVTEQDLEDRLRRFLNGEQLGTPSVSFAFGAIERITNYLEGYR